MSKYNVILEKLSFSIKQVEHLTNLENLSIENSKNSNLHGKEIDKYIKLLVKNEDGILLFSNWLTSDDDSLRWNAALNLFPLFPRKCIEVLISCKKRCTNELTKSSMKNVITAYTKGVGDNNIFIERLKKIYDVNKFES